MIRIARKMKNRGFSKNTRGGPLAEYVPLMAALSLSVIASISYLGDLTSSSLGEPKENLPQERIDVPPECVGADDPYACAGIDTSEGSEDPEGPEDAEYACSGFACTKLGKINVEEDLCGMISGGQTAYVFPDEDSGEMTVVYPGLKTLNTQWDVGGRDWTLVWDGFPGTVWTEVDFPINEFAVWHMTSEYSGRHWMQWHRWAYSHSLYPSPANEYMSSGDWRSCPNFIERSTDTSLAGEYSPYYSAAAGGPLIGSDWVEGTASFDTLHTADRHDGVIGFQSIDEISDSSSEEIIIPGPGDEIIASRDGADIYVYKLGDGNDEYTPKNTKSGDDKIHILDVESYDVEPTVNSDGDFQIAMPDGATLSVMSAFGTREQHRFDVLEFADRSLNSNQDIRDWFVGTQIPADGATSNDPVIGTGLGDNYLYSSGMHGSLHINDTNYSGVGPNALTFDDVDFADAEFFLDSDRRSLRIVMPDGDEIFIENQYYSTATERRWGASVLTFADATPSMEDVLTRAASDAMLRGGTVHLAEYFNDRAEYAASVHDDVTLISHKYTYRDDETDTLVLTESNPEDVVFGTNGDDLWIDVGGSRIEVLDTFIPSNAHHYRSDVNTVDQRILERVEFLDGTVLDREQQAEKVMTDQLDIGASTIHMTGADDIIRYDADQHGSVNIFISRNYSNDDVFITDTPLSDITLFRMSSDPDLGMLFPDGDTVIIDNQRRSFGRGKWIGTFIFDGVSYDGDQIKSMSSNTL